MEILLTRRCVTVWVLRRFCTNGVHRVNESSTHALNELSTLFSFGNSADQSKKSTSCSLELIFNAEERAL